MRKKKVLMLSLATLLAAGSLKAQSQEAWSLKDCIDYALSHNIQVKRNQYAEQTAGINVTEARAGLLPTLNANVSQSLQYRPLQETTSSFVNGSIASSSSNKVTQSGNYGINAGWVVWNGGKTRLNIRDSELSQSMAELATETTANSIQEQITQLYVQILYMQEAVKVNEELLVHDSLIYARGKDMLEQGQISRADLAQLEAQVSTGRYDVVNTRTQIDNCKMQLKQLLELAPGDDIDIATTEVNEDRVLTLIPGKLEIYQTALTLRPEIKRSETAIEQSDVSLRLARAGYMPTISATASLGDSHMTGTRDDFFSQMKNNFAANIGVSISIPIFDNRSTRSSVERAEVSRLTSQLDLLDVQKQLYTSIETYHLNATNSQEKYLAARTNVKSQQENYDLAEEQFHVGLKNIVELLTSRGNLLTAKQTLLQDKYTALLNIALLDFYQGKDINL